MPSPVGEGGSQRLTDEAFFSLGRGFAEGNALLLIHRGAVPLLPQEKAKVVSKGSIADGRQKKKAGSCEPARFLEILKGAIGFNTSR